MDHFYIRAFDHMIAKMTRYANWAAAQMFIDGKTTSAAGIISHSLGKFFRDYIINLGFLDGTRGLISVGMHVYYTFWKYAKLWEMNQLKRMGKPVDLPKLLGPGMIAGSRRFGCARVYEVDRPGPATGFLAESGADAAVRATRRQ